MSYSKLPDSYIIFICSDFDPFDRGRHKYEFRQLCVDDTSIELGDGTSKVFINALSKDSEMSDEMRAFLDYLCGQEPTSDLTRDIEARIAQAKQNKVWEDSYMTLREYYAEEFEEAEERITERVTEQVMDERNHEIARDMLADGKPIKEIVKYSKLSLEEVQAIAAELSCPEQ